MSEKSEAPPKAGDPVSQDPEKLPFKERFMAFVQEYGRVAFVVWFGIFFLTWGGFYLAIDFGLSVAETSATVSVFGWFELDGAWGAAYLATQLSKPIRIAATFALTPVLATAWKRLRGHVPEETAGEGTASESDSVADA